jgi:hypothetical protein
MTAGPSVSTGLGLNVKRKIILGRSGLDGRPAALNRSLTEQKAILFKHKK